MLPPKFPYRDNGLRVIAAFLALSLALPPSALALRQINAGAEENPALTNDLRARLLGSTANPSERVGRAAAGLEEFSPENGMSLLHQAVSTPPMRSPKSLQKFLVLSRHTLNVLALVLSDSDLSVRVEALQKELDRIGVARTETANLRHQIPSNQNVLYQYQRGQAAHVNNQAVALLWQDLKRFQRLLLSRRPQGNPSRNVEGQSTGLEEEERKLSSYRATDVAQRFLEDGGEVVVSTPKGQNRVSKDSPDSNKLGEYIRRVAAQFSYPPGNVIVETSGNVMTVSSAAGLEGKQPVWRPLTWQKDEAIDRLLVEMQRSYDLQVLDVVRSVLQGLTDPQTGVERLISLHFGENTGTAVRARIRAASVITAALMSLKYRLRESVYDSLNLYLGGTLKDAEATANILKIDENLKLDQVRGILRDAKTFHAVLSAAGLEEGISGRDSSPGALNNPRDPAFKFLVAGYLRLYAHKRAVENRPAMAEEARRLAEELLNTAASLTHPDNASLRDRILTRLGVNDLFGLVSVLNADHQAVALKIVTEVNPESGEPYLYPGMNIAHTTEYRMAARRITLALWPIGSSVRPTAGLEEIDQIIQLMEQGEPDESAKAIDRLVNWARSGKDLGTLEHYGPRLVNSLMVSLKSPHPGMYLAARQALSAFAEKRISIQALQETVVDLKNELGNTNLSIVDSAQYALAGLARNRITADAWGETIPGLVANYLKYIVDKDYVASSAYEALRAYDENGIAIREREKAFLDLSQKVFSVSRDSQEAIHLLSVLRVLNSEKAAKIEATVRLRSPTDLREEAWAALQEFLAEVGKGTMEALSPLNPDRPVTVLTNSFPQLKQIAEDAGYAHGVAELIWFSKLPSARLTSKLSVFVEKGVSWNKDGQVEESLKGYVDFVPTPEMAQLIIAEDRTEMRVGPYQAFLQVNADTARAVTPGLLKHLEDQHLLNPGSVVVLDILLKRGGDDGEDVRLFA